MRRQNTNVALDAQPLADGFRDLFHNLGQIAADVLLDKVGADYNVQILAVHAPSKVQERVLECGAEVDLSQHAVQFLGNRIAHFLGDKLQSLDKTVARAQRIRQQHQRIGQLFDELCATSVLVRPYEYYRGKETCDTHNESTLNIPNEITADQEPGTSQHQPQQYVFRGTDREVGTRKFLFQPHQVSPWEHHVQQAGNGTQVLQFCLGRPRRLLLDGGVCFQPLRQDGFAPRRLQIQAVAEQREEAHRENDDNKKIIHSCGPRSLS